MDGNWRTKNAGHQCTLKPMSGHFDEEGRTLLVRTVFRNGEPHRLSPKCCKAMSAETSEAREARPTRPGR